MVSLFRTLVGGLAVAVVGGPPFASLSDPANRPWVPGRELICLGRCPGVTILCVSDHRHATER
jgi:hypothetical protein